MAKDKGKKKGNKDKEKRKLEAVAGKEHGRTRG